MISIVGIQTVSQRSDLIVSPIACLQRSLRRIFYSSEIELVHNWTDVVWTRLSIYRQSTRDSKTAVLADLKDHFLVVSYCLIFSLFKSLNPRKSLNEISFVYEKDM